MVAILLILGLLIHTCIVVQCQDDYNNVTYSDTDDPCIHVKLRLSATITYRANDGNMSTVYIVGNNLTTDPDYNTCDIGSNAATASINISWPTTGDELYYSLIITFVTDFEKGWNVSKIELHINTTNNPDFPEFPVPLEDYILRNEKDLTVDNITLYKSYKCDSNFTHSLSSERNATALLTTTFLQLQAFQFSNSDGNFGSADMQCVEDVDDSKLVPAIVGSVITAVLLAALSLYIIARVVKHRKDSKEPLLT